MCCTHMILEDRQICRPYCDNCMDLWYYEQQKKLRTQGKVKNPHSQPSSQSQFCVSNRHLFTGMNAGHFILFSKKNPQKPNQLHEPRIHERSRSVRDGSCSRTCCWSHRSVEHKQLCLDLIQGLGVQMPQLSADRTTTRNPRNEQQFFSTWK